MKRFTLFVTTAVLSVFALAPAAQADFGLKDFSATFTNQDGTAVTQAGAHPFAVNVAFNLNTKVDPKKSGKIVPDGDMKSLSVKFPAGFIGATNVVPTCATADFLRLDATGYPTCPNATAVGAIQAKILNFGQNYSAPVYNLVPPPGVAVKIGFFVLTIPVTLEIGVNQEAPHNVVGGQLNLSQTAEVFGGDLQIWGVPADHAHDALRGRCLASGGHADAAFISAGICDTGAAVVPFLTMPRSCTGPLISSYEAISWQEPKDAPVHEGSFAAPGMAGCSKLGFSPTIESKATTSQAETGTGLEFAVDFHDEGLTSATGLAQSDIKDAKITLPLGMTINPSVGEGLVVCTPADIARETLHSAPGEGCPNASKLGTVLAETPLVEEPIEGEVFLAQQDDPGTTTPGAENPFDSLIALYMVIKNPNLGVIVKEPLKIEPDPKTGQLVTTLEDNVQIPIGHFVFHFREGARSPLVTPAACGTYETKAEFTPWANPDEILTTTSSFKITSGIAGGQCPPGGIPPFHPDYQAGSLNNNAKSYSPFNMRLIRNDGEQDMTKFSSVLPPGVLGKLAGVSKCPDSAIDVAKAKTGRQELASPSCPSNSEIGHTLAGAGVGGALTYVGGKIYLGGPYHGDPLSVIAITPAVAGPFDAGTVVVREALTLNPETAEVEVDGKASDPIPHIIKGIVLKLRDLRIYVDRPNFILNPTSCDPSSAKATLFGSFLNVFDPADDVPVDLSTRFQAANCLNLGFKPKLSLKLNGGTKRGDHPALRAVLNARPNDANIGKAVVTLPTSAFLDQAHIRTICTRVQFRANNCPKGAQYGYAKATTPLLEETIQGPVYLRSSNHKLPDLVAALHGLVDVNVVGRIDSFKGGIRSSFETVPDAPVTKFTLTMQGGQKGLVINSRNLCAKENRADALFTGQNGKPDHFHPLMKVSCKAKKHKRKQHKR